jgi:hypothetical protein
MSTSRPEADTEYSRGDAAKPGRETAAEPRPAGPSGGLALALTGGGLLGALLLVVAEFTPLLDVHSSARGNPVVKTIETGSHHAFALIPIALLAAALILSARRAPRARLAWAAVGALGLVALGIALIGDLPATHSSGLIGHAGGPYTSAASKAAIGMYLETLGAILLVLTGAAGVLLTPSAVEGPKLRLRPIWAHRRSAS